MLDYKPKIPDNVFNLEVGFHEDVPNEPMAVELQGMGSKTVQRTSIEGIVGGTIVDLVNRVQSNVQDLLNLDGEAMEKTSDKNVVKTSEQANLVDLPFLVVYYSGNKVIEIWVDHQEDGF